MVDDTDVRWTVAQPKWYVYVGFPGSDDCDFIEPIDTGRPGPPDNDSVEGFRSAVCGPGTGQQYPWTTSWPVLSSITRKGTGRFVVVLTLHVIPMTILDRSQNRDVEQLVSGNSAHHVNEQRKK